MSISHFFSHYPTIEYKTCCLYVRCSKEEQAKFGDTIEAQTEDLKEFARQHHLKVYAIYVDEGHTARKKYNKRKEFMRMLHDVELHKFKYIIFTKLDRWFSNISDFYKIQEILDSNGVTWLTALRNPLYKGEYRGNPDYCPKIIEPERFDRIQVLGKRNVKVRKTNRYYVFSGMAQCKECGHALVANTTHNYRYNREYTTYRCNYYSNSHLCTHSHGINEKKIEAYLLENIKPEIDNYLANYELKQNTPVKKTDPSKIKAKMQRLKDLYINELIDLDDYRIEYEKYKLELDSLTEAAPDKKDLSAIRSFLELDLQSIYEDLTPQEKRMLWTSIIDKILIDDGGDIELVFF